MTTQKIEYNWKALQCLLAPKDVDAIQRQLIHNAFYAGVGFAYDKLITEAAPLTAEMKRERYRMIHEEVLNFSFLQLKHLSQKHDKDSPMLWPHEVGASIIGQCWDLFQVAALCKKKLNALQRRALRKSFYTGAVVAYDLIMVQPHLMTLEDGTTHIKGIEKELHEYVTRKQL